MPAAAVTAVGAVAVGYMQHKSATNAAKAQKAATDAALAHETQREGITDTRYDRGWEAYQKDLADWKTRHGYASSAPAQGGQVHSTSGGATLQDLASMTSGAMGKVNPQPVDPNAAGGTDRTLQDLSKWNDWQSQGL